MLTLYSPVIRLIFTFFLASSTLFGIEIRKEPLEDYNERMSWFIEAEYGMFIHLGVYSQRGGVWKGKKIKKYAEWIQGHGNIPREEYAEILKTFNPTEFDADRMIHAAKDAGMNYLVITSKHHDGFCLWDSNYTEYDVASTPFKGRNILAELQEACNQYGMKFGIYYSIIDWHHPTQTRPSEHGDLEAWAGQTKMAHGRKQEYTEYQKNQVLELIEKYQPALLWFDGDWVDWWTLEDGIELYNTIRAAKPDIIVNNRVAKRSEFELDFVTQEQEHFDEAYAKHWEGCYTMNQSWGYKKHDHAWKSPETVYNKLKDINEKGGNLLLNVGPDGSGAVKKEAYTILRETAKLLKVNPIKKRIPHVKEVPGIKTEK